MYNILYTNSVYLDNASNCMNFATSAHVIYIIIVSFNIIDCPQGDQAWCDTVTAAHCEFEAYRKLCCETCNRLKKPTPEPAPTPAPPGNNNNNISTCIYRIIITSSHAKYYKSHICSTLVCQFPECRLLSIHVIHSLVLSYIIFESNFPKCHANFFM